MATEGSIGINKDVLRSLILDVGVGGIVGTQSAEFPFALPSNKWTVNHNFGRHPLVDVFGPGGAGMGAEVLHTSLNQVLVYFDGPVTGFAICS